MNSQNNNITNDIVVMAICYIQQYKFLLPVIYILKTIASIQNNILAELNWTRLFSAFVLISISYENTDTNNKLESNKIMKNAHLYEQCVFYTKMIERTNRNWIVCGISPFKWWVCLCFRVSTFQRNIWIHNNININTNEFEIRCWLTQSL